MLQHTVLHNQPLQSENAEQVLEPRVMTALVLLLQADGQTVTDQAMLEGVWPGLVVSDASLYKVVAQLRKALQDQQKPYQLIERVHSKGYRLLQPALRVEAATAQTASKQTTVIQSEFSHPQPAAAKKAIPPLWSIGLIVLAGFGWWLWQTVTTPSPAANHPPQTAAAVRQPAKHPPAQLAPAAGFSQTQWQQYQQAKWLAQQPKAAAVQQAVELLTELLPMQQQYAPLLTDLCNSYHFMHIYSDWPLQKVLALCEPLLRQALQLQPDSAAALASFGALMLSQQNIPAATQYLDQALALDAQDRNTLLWRAMLYRSQDQFPAAIQLLQQATKLDPLSGLLKRHYAYSLIGNGMLSEARDQFRQSLLLDGDYSDRALDELEMLPLTATRAIAYLKWAERFPDRLQHPGRLVNLAMVQLSLNQFAEAATTLEQAFSLYPQHQFVLLGKAMLAQASGHPAEARHLLSERAKRRPDHRMFQLQALLLADDVDFQLQQPKLLQLLPDFAKDPLAATRLALAQKQQVLVLYWLLTVREPDREQYQPLIADFVAAQMTKGHAEDSEADGLSLQLLCVVGLTDQANQLALQLLQHDWLPSPHDNYYLAEQHPLWRQLDPAIFEHIQQQRQKVLQAID
ncbi:tetratricopeptide repeat protein [Rheinheimera sp. SA_1]|uniref:tetratricopeptide repeat protein n=1 Tax=Rheinheimera sp. SA_1 TaxID=1827365 RepID=UPI0012FB47E4|nr:tetratricopeptide repeat protein [Rheinheimera sp. SA_1]